MAERPTSRALHDAAWAEIADLLDRQLSPLGIAAMDALRVTAGETILDVGCGTGQTLLQLADRVGTGGRIIGVDIARRLLDVARARAGPTPQISLRQEDAARLDLPDGCLDGVYSRFGLMGFADPVAAFTNLRRMTRRGGRLAFVCWRSLAENEIDFLPLRAAGLPTPVDGTPFIFERPDVVTGILRSAGFGEIRIAPFDAYVSCGGIDETMSVLTRVGPLGKILRENPGLMAEAAPRVRAALSARGNPVRLGAAVWTVTAMAA